MNTFQGENFSRTSVVNVGTIPAGGIVSLSQYGVRFYVVDSSGELQISTDTTPSKPYRKGTGERFVDELRFKRLEIRNNNAFAVSFKLWIGFGEYIDTTSEVVENYTSLVGIALSGNQIAGLGNVELFGAPNGSNFQRKAVLISNLDLANPLYVKDSAGNMCAACFAKHSISLPISGYIKIENTAATPIPCCISEIWYSLTT